MMRTCLTGALLLAVCAIAHPQTGGFDLISSTPAAGATNVSVNSQISLTFSYFVDTATKFVVRGERQLVLGTYSYPPDGGSIVLTPFAPLDPGATYTVDFSGVRDVEGRSPTPPLTFQFSTEGSARVVVTSLPQTAQAGAGERVPLSYQLRNLSAVGATITGSRTIYMLPDGTQLLNVSQPMRETLGRNASLTVPAEALVSPSMVAAARSEMLDRILVIRLFQGSDANGNPLRSLTDTAIYNSFPGDRSLFGQGLVAITPVRLISSVTGAVVVRGITVTAPTEGLTVKQGDTVRGRALVTASGNGVVIGRWLLDGKPFESFQKMVQAGSPSTIDTVRTCPTSDLGERRLQLQILSPNPMLSREVHFTVSPLLQTGRPRLLSPSFGAVLNTRESAPIVLRWQVVPGASGYVVGIADTLAALGCDATNQPVRGFEKSALLVQRRVETAGQTSLILSADDRTALENARAVNLYWTVQPLFPPSNEPLPDRGALPRSLRVPQRAAALQLLSPTGEGTVRAEGFEFAWVRPPTPLGVSEYRVQVFVEGDEGTPIFQALTREPRFAYAPVGGAALAAGSHLRWRVLGMDEGGRVAAISASAPLNLRAVAPEPMFAPVHAAFGRELAGVAFAPLTGERVASSQAGVLVTYREAEGLRRRLILDGTDVSALVDFGPSEARLPRRPLSAGMHTVQLVAEGPDGESLEARSWFVVAPQDETVPQGEAPPLAEDPNGVDNGLRLQLQTEVHDDDPFHIVATLEGGGVLGLLDGSVSVTATRSLTGGPFEVRTLLGNLNDGVRQYSVAAGDVGLQGSEFTVNGSSTRAFQANASTGGLKFNFTKTLDPTAGRTNFGNAADVTMGSIETAKFAQGTGLKFVQLRSEEEANGFGAPGFGPPSGLNADIWSVVGLYRIGDVLSVRGELARSKNSYLTAANTRSRSSGDAKTLALDYHGPQGWMATVRYRRHETGFLAPSAVMLQNNLQGWDVNAAGPLGPTTFLSVRYGLAQNVASSSVPDGNTHTLTANLDLQPTNFIPLQIAYQQTVAKGDSVIPGFPGPNTRDSQWTVGTMHRFGPVDASLSYSIAKFEDYEDFNDPVNDTPQDRTTRFLSAGLGAQFGRLSLRGDWSDNGVSRYDRDPLTSALVDGRDRQDNLRLQADYALATGWVASAVWSRGRSNDVLGLFVGDVDDVAFRLNWTPSILPASQSTFTLEIRRTRMLSGSARSTSNTFTLLFNGAGIFKR